MLPELSIHVGYMVVTASIAGLLGGLLGGDDEDDEFVEAHDLVLDALSDADKTNVTEAITDRNWRDQITIEEAQELYEERELRNMGHSRN